MEIGGRRMHAGNDPGGPNGRQLVAHLFLGVEVRCAWGGKGLANWISSGETLCFRGASLLASNSSQTKMAVGEPPTAQSM